MTARYRTIAVKPISEFVGAEIEGVNVASGVSDEQFGEIRAAYAEHGVIFLRDQQLSPGQHLEFARRWGPININRFFRAVDGHPEVAQVLKQPDQKTNIGGGWHTDHTYDQIPAMGSMLYALDVPKRGGDTLFASTCAAYDALSDGLKATLGGLRAVHSSREVFGATSNAAQASGVDIAGRIGNPEAATQDAVHPVVIRHPLSGRPSLYVNSGFTLHFEGWSREDRHIAQDRFCCRFEWTEGSLGLWDNRATHHKALNDYDGERRLMHRVTIEGESLEPAA